MPELIITISSASRGNVDLIIGNAIGSNFCNLLFILGLMSIIMPTKMDKEAKKIHIPVAIFSALIVLLLGTNFFTQTNSIVGITGGIVLIILFIIYFSYPIFIEISDIIETYKNKEEKNTINIFVCIINIIIGILLLKFGGDFVVDNSVEIANLFGISQQIIGMTIIAVGTALPELITSIVAIIKKDSDLAVGNLIGSCALNMFLILGIGATITPLTFSKEFNLSLIILVLLTLVVWLFNFIGKKNTITRFKGFILVAMYALYMLYLIK